MTTDTDLIAQQVMAAEMSARDRGVYSMTKQLAHSLLGASQSEVDRRLLSIAMHRIAKDQHKTSIVGGCARICYWATYLRDKENVS